MASLPAFTKVSVLSPPGWGILLALALALHTVRTLVNYARLRYYYEPTQVMRLSLSTQPSCFSSSLLDSFSPKSPTTQANTRDLLSSLPLLSWLPVATTAHDLS